MNKKAIRILSKWIGLTYLINLYYELRYQSLVNKNIIIMANYSTSYKRAFNRYVEFIKKVPARADISIRFRNMVVSKLRNKRLENDTKI